MIFVLRDSRTYEETFFIKCFTEKKEAIAYITESGYPLNEFKFIEGEPRIITLG